MNQYADTNAGLGMIPHKKKCNCLECENDRLREQVKELREALRNIVALDDGDKPDLWHFEIEFSQARATLEQTKGEA